MSQHVRLQDTKGDDWNQMAKEYAKMTGGLSNRPVEKLLEYTNAALPFNNATAILDNGCGPGPVMARLIKDYGSELSSDCKLECADFSEGMTQQVQKQKDDAPADSPWKRVDIKVQDAMNLEAVESNSKSHVTAGFVYFMTQDPQKCLSESKRVLKDGGVLAASSWEGSDWIDILNLLRKVRPDKTMPSLPETWSSTAALKGEFEKAGFHGVEAYRVPTTMAINTYEETADMFITKMPHIVALLKDVSDEEKAEYKKLAIAHMRELCPTVPGDLNGMALVAVGRK